MKYKLIAIIPFSDMGITASDYNGIRYTLARALIINTACDYIMDKMKSTNAVEEETLTDLENAIVDMVAHNVTIEVTL